MQTKIIYEARGKAREYCHLAANLYRGCGHGCSYCYAPSCTRQDPMEFTTRPTPRHKVLEELWADIKKPLPRQPVLLSFTSDPYQPIEMHHKITRRAIQILHHGGFPVVVLTKGGLRATRDFDLLGHEDWVGATLTFVDDNDSTKWEPYAAPPGERIAMLKAAKDAGLRTWASLEPVIDPGQTLDIIEHTHRFVDMFKVGKLNHHALAETINWRDFGLRAIDALKRHGCQFYIKKDLAKYIAT